MAAEVHAIIYAVALEIIVQYYLNEFLNRCIELEAIMDSRKLFILVTKHSNPAERRLLIDIFSLRESFKKGKLKRRAWIQCEKKPADLLANKAHSQGCSTWELAQETTGM